MFTDLNMWDAATAIAQSNTSQSADILRKKAQLLMERNDLQAAADTYIAIEDYISAVTILGQNEWYDKLISLVRNFSKAQYKELDQCVEWFIKGGKSNLAIETLSRMGDVSKLLQYYVQLKDWDEAFILTETHPQFAAQLYLPYADWLASKDRYSEARGFYHKAGEWDAAIRILKELSSAAIAEKRFADASSNFWDLASEISMKCCKESIKSSNLVNDLRKYQQWSKLYYAYHSVYSYIEEPFSSQLSLTLFFMARYVYHYCSKNPIPPGISLCHLLFSLGKLGKILGGYNVSKLCLEKLLKLSYPSEWEHVIETSLLTLNGQPKTDSEELCRHCTACGSENPALNLIFGDQCSICQEPFIHSFYSFDDLPLVYFTYPKSMDSQIALSRLKAEPLKGSKSLDIIVSTIQSKKLSGSLIEFDESILSALDPHQVFLANDKGAILCIIPSLKIVNCAKCRQFFLDEEWQFCVSCPFCKT